MFDTVKVRGSTVTVSGSISLALAVLAGPSAAGSWCAALGDAALGLAAAAQAGVVLERLAVVAAAGDQWAEEAVERSGAGVVAAVG